jgi:ornithine carrier protein
MCENASLFVVYNQLQLALRRASGIQPDAPLGLGHLAIAAAGAGSIVSFILYGKYFFSMTRGPDAFLLL